MIIPLSWIFMSFFTWCIYLSMQFCSPISSAIFNTLQNPIQSDIAHSFCVWDTEKNITTTTTTMIQWNGFSFPLTRLIDAMETCWHRNRILCCFIACIFWIESRTAIRFGEWKKLKCLQSNYEQSLHKKSHHQLMAVPIPCTRRERTIDTFRHR